MVSIKTILFHFTVASECDIDNGGCDHYCSETVESYTCSCYVGYILHTDQHTCVGECGVVTHSVCSLVQFLCTLNNQM